MNSVNLIGVVQHGSKKTWTEAGRPVLGLTVIVPRPSRRPGGSGADWVPCTLFGPRALEMTVEEGQLVAVSGRIRLDADGRAVVSIHDLWRVDESPRGVRLSLADVSAVD